MTPEERFEQYVERDYKFVNPLQDSCWVWTGARDKDGYGLFQLESKRTVRAHRYAYESHNATHLGGSWVLHNCDNPSCVNPGHLRPGSARQNEDDKIQRGRDAYRRSDRHYGAKLSDQDVQEIRRQGQAGRAHRAIASQFGVSRSHVSNLIAHTKRP